MTIQEREDTTGAEDRKERPTPLPKLQLFIVFLIQFAEPVTAAVIYPFVNQLVRETGITAGDESKTGYYAGIIQSTFFFSETCTVLAWGWLSDMFGRKPVLLMGPLGLSLSMLGFGLSRSFWPLVYFRTFQGLFNGNIGVSKSVLAEITDSTNIGDAYALSPLVWSAGLALGPTLGGVLSNPAERWPETLGKIAFLRGYPYFLSCAAAGLVAFTSFLFSSIAMKETLPSSRKNKIWSSLGQLIHWSRSTADETSLLASTESSGYGATNVENASAAASKEQKPPLSHLFVRQFVITIFNYGLLAFTDMSMAALLPLVYSTPIEYGGLNMDPFKIGVIMGIFGLVRGFGVALLLGSFIRQHGATNVYKFSIFSFFVTFAAFPIANALARRAGGIDAYVAFVIFLQFMAMSLISPCYAAMGILVVENCPNKLLLGSANGAAQTVTSGSRALAPAIASSLFSISLQHNLAGGYAVYYILLTLTAVLIRASQHLPVLHIRTPA